MIYAYIDEQRVHVSVVRLCHALGVSTSGYYARRQRGPSQRDRVNAALLVHLRAIRVETHETYGSPRMHAELVARGQPCSVNRVARLMRVICQGILIQSLSANSSTDCRQGDPPFVGKQLH